MEFKHYLKNILTFSTMDFDKEPRHFQRFMNMKQKKYVTVSTSLARGHRYGTFFSVNFWI